MTTVYVPEGVTKRTFNKLARRVAKGAALLDREDPAWWRRVKQSELTMSQPMDCILGQAWIKRNGSDWGNGWDNGVHMLFKDGHEDSYDQAGAHGFNFKGTDSYEDLGKHWSVLADLWIAEIRDRRRQSRQKTVA